MMKITIMTAMSIWRASVLASRRSKRGHVRFPVHAQKRRRAEYRSCHAIAPQVRRRVPRALQNRCRLCRRRFMHRIAKRQGGPFLKNKDVLRFVA